MTTENRNVPQQGKNPDEVLMSIEERMQRAKSQMMSIFSEEQLAKPEIQKRLAIYDSPEYHEFLKKHLAAGSPPTLREWNDFWESQGFPVKREYPEMFRYYFPTGEPEDYDQKMRLKIAEMFLAQEPVDLTDPRAAAHQRLNVVSELITDKVDVAWYLGRFGDEWDGPILLDQENTRRNAATEWVKDVQRNAASIVAAAKTAEVNTPEIQPSTPSWDLSSVMAPPSVSHSETEVPTTPDASGSVLMTDVEIEAEIEKSLTSQPREVLPDERPDTPSQIQSNLETTLKSQFSSERFERAMSTLEQYGTDEGLRHLRENDPEVAKQIERHRKRFRSKDSDKSEEEVSK